MRDMTEIEDRLGEIRDELARIGRPDVRIIAVTKGFGVEAWNVARDLGLDIVGESYAQELQAKLAEPDDRPTIHFIGRIQRNKVRKVIDDVALWHSVARPEILTELGKRRPGARALLQLSVADDPTKDGITAAEIPSMLEVAEAADVRVEGFMTIGVQGDAAASAAAFHEVDRLAEAHGVAERSMGMSNDWRDAAAAGATLLRLGSVLFGPRP
jgi:pyridoxal phosphate enzyme (YggS family)